MRVLQVSKTSEGAFWAARQAAELGRSGVEVHVALPERAGAAVAAWEKSGAVIHCLDCSLPVLDPLRAVQNRNAIRQLVREIQPDLIHSHFVSTTLMVRAALGRNGAIPRIFQVPGPLHLEHWHSRLLEIGSAGARDFWVGSSRFVCGAYEASGIAPEKLFLSYYSSETQASTRRRTGYLRRRLGIPQDAFVVGNVNLIYPPKKLLGQQVGLKCHEDVIEAIELAQKVRSDVWGVLIGGTFGSSGKYEHRLRQLALRKGRGQILMPGKFNAEEVASSWPDYDCAVHAPLSENCGGVVEPLLAGVPTIAGDVGGLPEVVHHHRTGEIVPIRSPQELANAILRVREQHQEYSAMAARGRELVSAMFDPQRCTAEILAIYRHILYSEKRPDNFDPQTFLDELETRPHAAAAGAR